MLHSLKRWNAAAQCCSRSFAAAAEQIAQPDGVGATVQEGADALAKWREAFATLPPVSFVQGMTAPTAMSWIRRRAPPELHEAAAWQLFRHQQIRVFDGKVVKRVKARRTLGLGDVLLYPRSLAAKSIHPQELTGQAIEAGKATGTSTSTSTSSSSDGTTVQTIQQAPLTFGATATNKVFASPSKAALSHATASSTTSPMSSSLSAATAAAPAKKTEHKAPTLRPDPFKLTPERVRRWVLRSTKDVIFIAKPAGVNVQGRGDTLDTMMQTGLQLNPDDQPKLVHRLDMQVSGVMAIARNADAAHWLSACFREKSALATDTVAGSLPDDLYIKRTYWAFVAGRLQQRLSGRIRFPVIIDGKFFPAVTQFKVRHSSDTASWVELIPETGRRHQLRVHCARALHAPIIGDSQYGYRGLNAASGLYSRVPHAWWDAFGGSGSALPVTTERSSSSGQEQYDAAGADDAADMEEAEEPEMNADGAAMASSGRRVRSRQSSDKHMPILLHARTLVVKQPQQNPVTVTAPLPLYIRQLIHAEGWPMPA